MPKSGSANLFTSAHQIMQIQSKIKQHQLL